jgi:hypothetical protein
VADLAKQQAEVLSDAFQESGYDTSVYARTHAHGWAVNIRASGHNIARILVDDHSNIMLDWDNKDVVQPVLAKYGLTKYMLSAKPKFKTLEINGRRWFQRTYGNTYHTFEILIDGRNVFNSPRHYGGGSMYEQNAAEWLVKNGHLPSMWTDRSLWQLRDEGITFSSNAVDVPRQRDL